MPLAIFAQRRRGAEPNHVLDGRFKGTPIATNNFQPTTFNQQLSTNNLQPTTFNQQPSTNNLQPTTFNQQPSTSNQQRTSNNQQRSPSNPKPPREIILCAKEMFNDSLKTLSSIEILSQEQSTANQETKV
jgi:hypothetical protein